MPRSHSLVEHLTHYPGLGLLLRIGTLAGRSVQVIGVSLQLREVAKHAGLFLGALQMIVSSALGPIQPFKPEVMDAESLVCWNPLTLLRAPSSTLEDLGSLVPPKVAPMLVEPNKPLPPEFAGVAVAP